MKWNIRSFVCNKLSILNFSSNYIHPKKKKKNLKWYFGRVENTLKVGLKRCANDYYSWRFEGSSQEMVFVQNTIVTLFHQNHFYKTLKKKDKQVVYARI